MGSRHFATGRVAEVPAIEGCYALVNKREEALAGVFGTIAEEYAEKGLTLPAGNTIGHAGA
jgi:hypothetical protein